MFTAKQPRSTSGEASTELSSSSPLPGSDLNEEASFSPDKPLFNSKKSKAILPEPTLVVTSQIPESKRSSNLIDTASLSISQTAREPEGSATIDSPASPQRQESPAQILADEKKEISTPISTQKSKASLSSNKFFKPTSQNVCIQQGEFADNYEQLTFISDSKDEGQSGFEIFGLTREEGVAALLQYADSSSKKGKAWEIRNIAAPEIRQAFLKDTLPKEMQDHRFKVLKKQCLESHQLLERKLRELNKKEFSDENKLSLYELMLHLYNETKTIEYNELLKAKRNQICSEIKLDAYCEDTNIFGTYIRIHYGQNKMPLKYLYDAEHNPITSVLDAFAAHQSSTIFIFQSTSFNSKSHEESKEPIKQTALPLHKFDMGNKNFYRVQLITEVKSSALDSPQNYYLLEPLKKSLATDVLNQDGEVDKLKIESKMPQQLEIQDVEARLYTITADNMKKAEWENRYYHEALHAIFQSSKRPEYLGWLKVLLGSNLKHHELLARRARIHDRYTDKRDKNKYVLYSTALNIAHQEMRRTYQKKVLMDYKTHITTAKESETGFLRTKLETLNQELKELETKVQALDAYKNMKAEIERLSKFKELYSSISESKNIEQLELLIATRKQKFSDVNPHHKKQKELLHSLQGFESELKECEERWANEILTFQDLERCFDNIVEAFSMQYSYPDDEWQVALSYRQALEKYIASQYIMDSSTSSQKKLAKEIAKQKADIYLNKFEDYEKQLKTTVEKAALIIENPDEFKKKIQDELNEKIKEHSRLCLEDVSFSRQDLSLNARFKDSLTTHYTDDLETIRNSFLQSSLWYSINGTCSLTSLVNKLRSKESELKEKNKAASRTSKDINEYCEYDEHTIIKKYEEESRKWLSVHQDIIPNDIFLGETPDEIQDSILDLGRHIGHFSQENIVEPHTQNTLLHWTCQLLHRNTSKDSATQDSLFEIMCILFGRGSSIHVVNRQNQMACHFNELPLHTPTSWRVIVSALGNFYTTSELVEKLRSELYTYSLFTDLRLNGDWWEAFYQTISTPFLNVTTKQQRMSVVKKLILAMSKAEEMLDDKYVIDEMDKIIHDKDPIWSGSTLRAKIIGIYNEYRSNQLCTLTEKIDVSQLRKGHKIELQWRDERIHTLTIENSEWKTEASRKGHELGEALAKIKQFEESQNQKAGSEIQEFKITAQPTEVALVASTLPENRSSTLASPARFFQQPGEVSQNQSLSSIATPENN